MLKFKFFLATIFFLFTISLIARERLDKNGSVVLKGIVSVEQLSNEKKFDWFSSGIKNYQPKNTIVESLKSYKDFTLIVVLGTWCSDTKEQLPKLIKVLQQIGYPVQSVKLIAVDRNKKLPKNLRQFSTPSVPTVFVLEKNIMTGKIVETPFKSIEEDLLEILKRNQ